MTISSLLQAVTTSVLVASVVGCAHSEPFTVADNSLAEPYSSAPPIRLTMNLGDNYWPSWTEDGKGIIYSYSYPQPASHADDRCLGVLPPSGGTRVWQLCDERREHADSADSFAAAAIGSDGRLIYLEAATRRGSGGLSGVNQPPKNTVLWLADTALPFQRRALLVLGAQVSDRFVNWFRDTHWIGPASFVTLAQFNDIRAGSGAVFDSVFTGLGVVRGEIGPTAATFTMVPGTEGAQSYSLAEGGASLIIWRSGLTLERVPLAGGTPTTAATVPAEAGRTITSFSCQASVCLVSTTTPAPPSPVPVGRIWRVSLVSNAVTELATSVDGFLRLSPVSTDVVARNVTSMTVTTPGAPPRALGSLFLYQGLLP